MNWKERFREQFKHSQFVNYPEIESFIQQERLSLVEGIKEELYQKIYQDHNPAKDCDCEVCRICRPLLEVLDQKIQEIKKENR